MRRPHRFQPQKSLHQRRTGLLLAPGWCTHAELTDAAACRKPATRATCTSYASGSPQREAWVPPRAAVSLPPARPHCRPVMDGTGAVCPDQWRGELGRARALSRGAFRCVTPENWGGVSVAPLCGLGRPVWHSSSTRAVSQPHGALASREALTAFSRSWTHRAGDRTGTFQSRSSCPRVPQPPAPTPAPSSGRPVTRADANSRGTDGAGKPLTRGPTPERPALQTKRPRK